MTYFSSDARKNHLIDAMSPADRTQLLDLSEQMTFSRGEILIPPGQTIAHVYFPLSGICSVVAVTSDTDYIEAGVIGREGFVGGEVILGADRTINQCLVQVAGDYLCLPAARLVEMSDRSAPLQKLLLRYVHILMLQISQTALANGRLSIEKRLARWILMCHDRIDGDELYFTHELLSIMLGVRRPGVTVATHVLEGEKMIRSTRGRLTVLDRKKLEESAGSNYGLAEREYERLIAPSRLPYDDAVPTPLGRPDLRIVRS